MTLEPVKSIVHCLIDNGQPLMVSKAEYSTLPAGSWSKIIKKSKGVGTAIKARRSGQNNYVHIGLAQVDRLNTFKTSVKCIDF